MDPSKLSANDRLAAVAAAALVVAGAVAALTYRTYGITWLAIVAAIAMLFVVFQPQIAPATKLPGSHGGLMLIAGGLAGVVMVLALLTTLDFVFLQFGIADLLFLVAVAAAVAMAWAGWRAFQAEGGRFAPGPPAPPQPPPDDPGSSA